MSTEENFLDEYPGEKHELTGKIFVQLHGCNNTFLSIFLVLLMNKYMPTR